MIFHIHPAYEEHCGAKPDMQNVHCTNVKDVDCPICRKNIDHQTLQSGDTYTFNFPRTSFVTENGICMQSKHIGSEAMEIDQSVYTPDINHTAEEVMDCLHSCETALRILQEKHGINLNEVRARVKAKNMMRGYYS